MTKSILVESVKDITVSIDLDSLPTSESQESHTLSASGVMAQDVLYPRGSMRLVRSLPPARATKARRARVRQVTPFRARLAKLFPELQSDGDDTP